MCFFFSRLKTNENRTEAFTFHQASPPCASHHDTHRIAAISAAHTPTDAVPGRQGFLPQAFHNFSPSTTTDYPIKAHYKVACLLLDLYRNHHFIMNVGQILEVINISKFLFHIEPPKHTQWGGRGF